MADVGRRLVRELLRDHSADVHARTRSADRAIGFDKGCTALHAAMVGARCADKANLEALVAVLLEARVDVDRRSSRVVDDVMMRNRIFLLAAVEEGDVDLKPRPKYH